MKFVGSDLFDAERARDHLFAEVRLAAKLQHPGIVPVHDAGTMSDGRIWFTIKEVRGVTLRRVLGSMEQRRITVFASVFKDSRTEVTVRKPRFLEPTVAVVDTDHVDGVHGAASGGAGHRAGRAAPPHALRDEAIGGHVVDCRWPEHGREAGAGSAIESQRSLPHTGSASPQPEGQLS
ncbi:hypothetical protein [Polyangium fumosum]|uniref:Protein kinase domain-containing protein n=1 Tax=Polyangium fumosum TaxID=889272 RepID=A0A4U1IGY7_9BACT|nr:hypothetical protein [Polyangium fumosum]TKC92981.1 hypothetical protein E8A74_50225 [Polyangium fumosum]